MKAEENTHGVLRSSAVVLRWNRGVVVEELQWCSDDDLMVLRWWREMQLIMEGSG